MPNDLRDANASPTPEPIAKLEPGLVIAGFRLVERIGAGGMGEVWRCENATVSRIIRAMKVIRPGFAAVPEFRARFLREAEYMEVLQHPNILRVENVGEENGLLFMLMELLQGLGAEDLAGKFPIAPACRVIFEAALGVAHAHQNGILHRDLKPANLFITQDGVVRVLDFGIARPDTRDARLTSPGTAAPGTPAYYAPELARGKPSTPASDVYALGVSLFELVSGRLPFAPEPGVSSQEALLFYLHHHAHEPMPDVRTVRPDVSEEIAAIIERATAKDPAERIPDAAALAEALEPHCAEVDLAAAVRDCIGPTSIHGKAPVDTAPRPKPRLSSGVRPAVRPPSTGARKQPAPISEARFPEVTPKEPEPPPPPVSREELLAAEPPAPRRRRLGLPLAFALAAVVGGAYVFTELRKLDRDERPSAHEVAPLPTPPRPATPLIAPTPKAPVANATCPEGEAVGPETDGHCCKPHQLWSAAHGRCVAPTANGSGSGPRKELDCDSAPSCLLRCDAHQGAACEKLAMMYQTGAGAPADPGRALRYHERACEEGIHAACRRGSTEPRPAETAPPDTAAAVRPAQSDETSACHARCTADFQACGREASAEQKTCAGHCGLGDEDCVRACKADAGARCKADFSTCTTRCGF